jgi:hypothetical protein
MRRIALLVIIALCAASLAQSSMPDAERELARLTNQDRAEETIAPLESNEKLAQAAREHLRVMMRERKLSHQFPGEPTVAERIAATKLRFQASGENVAFFTDRHNAKDNAAEANDILMHSPPHRENILRRDYTAIGIAMGSAHDEVWVVEDFARAFTTVSAADVEAQIEHAMQEARSKHKLPRLKFETDPSLHKDACQNDVSPSRVLHAFPQARSADIFTLWDPTQLPSGVMNRVTSRETRNVAIAACEVSGATGHGSYRLIALFY